MIAYKLFRVRKDGTLGPLYINRKQRILMNEWLEAESHPTKGFALRPGWHTTSRPEAPHLSMKGRAWFEVEIEDYYPFERPSKQGGMWYIAKRMRVLNRLEPYTKEWANQYLEDHPEVKCIWQDERGRTLSEHYNDKLSCYRLPEMAIYSEGTENSKVERK